MGGLTRQRMQLYCDKVPVQNMWMMNKPLSGMMNKPLSHLYFLPFCLTEILFVFLHCQLFRLAFLSCKYLYKN